MPANSMVPVAEREALDSGRQRIAHLAFKWDPTNALCGAKLKGVPAREPVDKCVVCMDLAGRSDK